MQCFPSIALLVACCPDTTISPPREHGCPENFLAMRDGCCQRGIVSVVLKALGTLSPENLQDLAHDGYRQSLENIGNLMRAYLLDSDHSSVDAWRLFTSASARSALMAVDFIKDRFVRIQSVEESQRLLADAIDLNRRLARALFRLETYYIFLLGHTSAVKRRRMQELGIEEVRQAFEPSLELYESGMQAFDFVAYSLVPNLQVFSRQLAATSGRGYFLQDLAKQRNGTVEVALLLVSLGDWAKTGFLTLWSVLQHRTTDLRVVVLGDGDGLIAWQLAVQELQDQGSQFRGVRFEYINFETSREFATYLESYPTNTCNFGAAGKAILARVVCHLLLPADISKIISIDVGDIIVLDDILKLWDEFGNMEEHHVIAAPHAVALHHVNAGVVLYDLARMRERKFEAETLKAVFDMQRRAPDPTCLRDQSIINALHSWREEFGYTGPSPVMILPCTWSVFPTTEWLSYWNSPERWLPELRDKRRYPGMVSINHIEVYCPDETDLLSAWAFLPLTATEEESRQQRLRLYALYQGQKLERDCSPLRSPACCRCGDRVSLLHIAGDMKNWLAMRALLQAYMPPWKEAPLDPFAKTSSQVWSGGDTRIQQIVSHTGQQAVMVAKAMGLEAVFETCALLHSKGSRDGFLEYAPVQLRKFQLPVRVDVETTAKSDGFVLLGVGSHSGLELVLNEGEGPGGCCLRWVRSAPASEQTPPWTYRQDIYCTPFRLHGRREAEESWSSFSLAVGLDGLINITFGTRDVEFGMYMPPSFLSILMEHNLTVSVAGYHNPARWLVCADKS